MIFLHACTRDFPVEQIIYRLCKRMLSRLLAGILGLEVFELARWYLQKYHIFTSYNNCLDRSFETKDGSKPWFCSNASVLLFGFKTICCVSTILIRFVRSFFFCLFSYFLEVSIRFLTLLCTVLSPNSFLNVSTITCCRWVTVAEYWLKYVTW